MSSSAAAPTYQDIANSIANASNSDVILINSPIARPLDLALISACGSRNRRENVVLLLITEGGDADAAYRIARCLQDSYKRFTLFVSGYCKSAGTLVALGAHELVMSNNGELGPLDVQMSKPDELAQMQSGLTAMSALGTLHKQAFEAFENFFLQLVSKSGNSISTRTATQLAVQLSTGLFSPLYAHMDPMHVGEAGRALLVAQKYGQLLDNKSKNLKPRSLVELTTQYPSHGFVIDRLEAERLFQNVREADPVELSLAEVLASAAIDPISDYNQQLVAFLSDELPKAAGTIPAGTSANDPITPSAPLEAGPQPQSTPREEPGAPELPDGTSGQVVQEVAI